MLKRIKAYLQGQQAETTACLYLKQQGLSLVAKNFRCRMGEIDLIMRDQQSLVFIEVRYRQRKNYGSSAESITMHKRKKLLRSAELYLQQHHLIDKVPCRFDIIAMSNNTAIEWIKNAFTYDSIR